MPEIKIYNVEALGKPLGQYSHVTRVRANEHLFIAGMLAAGETFDAQCSGVFSQIEAALKSAGAGWGNVVQFTTYLVHSQDIPKFMTTVLRDNALKSDPIHPNARGYRVIAERLAERLKQSGAI